MNGTMKARAATVIFLAVPAFANESISQVNNQESLAVGLAPVHVSEAAVDQQGGSFVNHEAGTRFLFGYDAARTRTILGIPDLYTDLDVLVGVATLRYDGTALASSTAANSSISDSLSYVDESVRVRVGRTLTFFKSENLALTPFAGVTQKAWLRDTSVSGMAGFYDHEGAEVGALVQMGLPSSFVFGADAAVGRALAAVSFDGAGSRIVATTSTFSLKLDHRTFPDWHQRVEIRQNFLRYAQPANIPALFEPRRTSDLAIMLEIGGETSVF
jgi:hypothetical protein